MENKEGNSHWGGRGRSPFSRIAEKDWEFGVNIVNAVGKTFISGAEITKLLLRKDLLFENKRLYLTPC